MIQEKSLEVKTSGIDHGGREVGRETSSQAVKVKSTVRVIWTVKTVEYLL
jgi:hypothetical protein